MTWQPIETAPNSGEIVVVWNGRSHILMRADDYHAVPKPYWLDEATHWMPLPPPPLHGGGAG